MSLRICGTLGLAFVGAAFVFGAETFNPRRLMPPLPPITSAPVIPASQVTDQVSGPELVLGIVLNGQARAYPINMLTGPRREIINDTLGGRPIIATW